MSELRFSFILQLSGATELKMEGVNNEGLGTKQANKRKSGDNQEHNESRNTSKSNKVYRCSVSSCNVTYARADYINDHILHQHHGFLYTCDCKTKHTFRHSLRRHLDICSIFTNADSKYLKNPSRAAKKKRKIYDRELQKGEQFIFSSGIAIRFQWFSFFFILFLQ